MKAPRTVAALSIGLVGFGFAGCPQRPRPIRAVEPRLTGGAKYARCPTDEPSSSLIAPAVCGKPRLLGKDHGSPKGGPVLRGPADPKLSDGEGATDGLDALLRDGTPRGLNRAIHRLETTSGADPRNARNWSDLGAAYFVRASRTEDPRDLLRAYGAADRAVREDSSLPEARFNRALALERLFLVPDAIEAWQDYLRLDAAPGWATEAKRHQRALAKLSAPNDWEGQRGRLEQASIKGDMREVEGVVDRHRQAAREFAEQVLFGQWADAVEKGQKELAASRLSILRGVGDALVKIDGEHLVHDSVAVIDAVSAAGDPGRWRDLVRACRSLRDGELDYHARRCEQAVKKLLAARKTLARIGSPLVIRADLLLIFCDYQNSQFLHGLEGTEGLFRELQGRAYAGLRGSAFWARALLEDSLGRKRAAVDDYRQMMAEFRGLGEGEHVSRAVSLLGHILISLGRERQAWQYIYQALQTLPSLSDDVARANLFLIAGDAALRDGADAAALLFARARVGPALHADAVAAVEALVWRARMQEHMGDREAAEASLREAAARIGGLEASQIRHKRADLAMIEGEMRVEDDPRRAVDLLTSALAVYQKDENRLFSLRTLLARGQAQRRLRDDLAAEQDLRSALLAYDRLGEQLSEEDLRLSLLEETNEVFDEMISLQAGHDPDLAFAYADRSRTRVLPGTESALWTSGASVEPQPLPMEEIRSRLPAGTTLVQLSVLPDRVLIWELRRDERRPRFYDKEISRRELEWRAASLQDFGSVRGADAAVKLFDLLVGPWLAAVPAGERIVFIPDKVLHQVPFAVLKNRSTGRLLIEDHPLAVAPSATLYIHALERQAADQKAGRSAGLVIGDPAVDRVLFSDLPSLPESAAEVRRIASLTHSRLLEGKDAVKSTFLTLAPLAEWIHFSGHALVDPRNPLQSKLVLAPEGARDPGALTAQEIYSLKLPRTRLVVLAACDTGNEYIPSSEGATSLARAFLAAGVPSVVASLWSVDDRVTAELFAAFHRFLAAGDDPVDALRKAQLGMLHGSGKTDRSMRAWGAFEVIGASAE